MVGAGERGWREKRGKSGAEPGFDGLEGLKDGGGRAVLARYKEGGESRGEKGEKREVGVLDEGELGVGEVER